MTKSSRASAEPVSSTIHQTAWNQDAIIVQPLPRDMFLVETEKSEEIGGVTGRKDFLPIFYIFNSKIEEKLKSNMCITIGK